LKNKVSKLAVKIYTIPILFKNIKGEERNEAQVRSYFLSKVFGFYTVTKKVTV